MTCRLAELFSLVVGWFDVAGSILERVKLTFPGHRNGERMQSVQHLHGAGMMREAILNTPHS